MDAGPNLFDLTSLSESFTKEYKKLLDNKSGEGSPSRFEPGPPQLVILDVGKILNFLFTPRNSDFLPQFFLLQTLQCIRAVSGHSVPVYALQSGAAGAVHFMFGPEGRYCNLEEDLKAVSNADQGAYLDEADKVGGSIERAKFDIANAHAFSYSGKRMAG